MPINIQLSLPNVVAITAKPKLELLIRLKSPAPSASTLQTLLQII